MGNENNLLAISDWCEIFQLNEEKLSKQQSFLSNPSGTEITTISKVWTDISFEGFVFVRPINSWDLVWFFGFGWWKLDFWTQCSKFNARKKKEDPRFGFNQIRST